MMGHSLPDLLIHPVEYFTWISGVNTISVLKMYLLTLLGYTGMVTLLAASGLAVSIPLRISVPAGFPVVFPSSFPHQVWLLLMIGGSLLSVLFCTIVTELVLWGVFGLGCTKGIRQTLKARLVSQTPFFLFSWLPFLWIPAIVYDLVLFVIGIRELHGISTAKAVCAVFLFPLMCIVLAAVLLGIRAFLLTVR